MHEIYSTENSEEPHMTRHKLLHHAVTTQKSLRIGAVINFWKIWAVPD